MQKPLLVWCLDHITEVKLYWFQSSMPWHGPRKSFRVKLAMTTPLPGIALAPDTATIGTRSYQRWWWWVTGWVASSWHCTLICSVTMLRSLTYWTYSDFEFGSYNISEGPHSGVCPGEGWRPSESSVLCISLLPMWMGLQLVTTAAL